MILRRIIYLTTQMFLCFIIFESCNVKPSYLEKDIQVPDEIKSCHIKSNNIINDIASYPTVDGKYIGYVGETSEQYLRYAWLTKNATNELLLKSRKDKSANVRVYAFWALQDRKAIELKNIILENLKDTLSFSLNEGCIIDRLHLNLYFLNLGTSLFSEKEIAQCMKVISKFYTKEEWAYICKPQQGFY